MASLVGIFRIGRDPELRHTPKGDEVLTLSVVYNYGQKQQDGNRPSQWVDTAIFGKRATTLQPYLTKGSQVYLVIQDAHVETYQTKDGREGSRFTGRVLDIELIGGRSESKPQAEKPKYQHKDVNGDDFMDDIPFASLNQLIKHHLI